MYHKGFHKRLLKYSLISHLLRQHLQSSHINHHFHHKSRFNTILSFYPSHIIPILVMADNSRPRSSHMHFSVKTRDNVVYGLSMQASTTIKELKDKLVSQVNVSPDRQRLIFSGCVLRDGRTIDDYNIRNGNVVHLVISGAVRAAPAASTVTVSSCPSAAIVAAFEAQSVPTRSSAGPGSDSRPALSSAGDADRLAHDVSLGLFLTFGSTTN